MRTLCAPTIPSCSNRKVRFLVINVLNDCCIGMYLNVYVCEKFQDEILLRRGGCEIREEMNDRHKWQT